MRAVATVRESAEQAAAAAHDSAGKTQEVSAVAEQTAAVAKEGVQAAEEVRKLARGLPAGGRVEYRR